jgi:hypothetical protein
MVSALIIGIMTASVIMLDIVTAQLYRQNVSAVGPGNRAVLALENMEQDCRQASALTVNNGYWITLTEPLKGANNLNTIGVNSGGTQLQLQTSTTPVQYFLGVYNSANPDTNVQMSAQGTWLYRATVAPVSNTFSAAYPVLRGGVQPGSTLFVGADPHFLQMTFAMTPDTGIAPVTTQTAPTVTTQFFLRNVLP